MKTTTFTVEPEVNGSLQRRPRASPDTVTDHQTESLLGKRSDKEPRLLRWDEIEPWQQDNEYIISHYRPASYSYKKSFESLGYLHNETVNIFSHLLGALVVAVLAVTSLMSFWSAGSEATTSDALVLGIFFASATGCLTTSTLFHTLLDHSPGVWKATNFADFLGILALITGSFYPGVYYGFYCHTTPMYTYWTMITIASSGCAIVCSWPAFSTPKWRMTRALLFVSLALSGILPIVHSIILYGWQGAKQVGMAHYILEAVFYITGAVLYSARFPERLKPEFFDVWGASHQILHVMVLFGIASHLAGVLTGYTTAHDSLGTKCT